MTDFPITIAKSVRKSTPKFDMLSRLTHAALASFAAVTRVMVRQFRKVFIRRTADEILIAQARREEARRAVDRLLR